MEAALFPTKVQLFTNILARDLKVTAPPEPPELFSSIVTFYKVTFPPELKFIVEPSIAA